MKLKSSCPPHIPLNVKWENKEREELAEYYLYMAERSYDAQHCAFFLRGYLDIKNIELDEEEIRNSVKERIAFFRGIGYTQEDMAAHCHVSRTVITNLESLSEINSSKEGARKIKNSYLAVLYRLSPTKVAKESDYEKVREVR